MKLNFFKKLTITRKLTIFYSLVFSLTIFLLSACMLYSVEFYEFYAAHADIEAMKQTIITNNKGEENLKDTIRIAANKNIYIRLYEDDNLLFESEGFVYDFDKESPIDIVLSHDDDRKHYLTENTKFTIEDSNYRLELVKDLYSEKNFLKLLFLVIALMDIAGIVVSVFLGYLFSKKILQPVGEITSIARKINAQNLSERIPLSDSKDELYMLSQTFNEMADRLQTSFDRQSQFVSDASHELKTPIAAIKGHVNLLERWGKDDKEALESSLGAIRKESDNMSQLVLKLLYLAKMDKENAITITTFDFALLAHEIVDEMALYNENHKIIYDGDESMIITSDESMLRQLIRILTDNAVKFTPNNQTITVGCKTEDRRMVMFVKDTGCGIPKDNLPYIFDRFYIVNEARNKDKSGNGLGLSIAKRICELLNARIEVTSEVEIGTEFKIFFF